MELEAAYQAFTDTYFACALAAVPAIRANCAPELVCNFKTFNRWNDSRDCTKIQADEIERWRTTSLFYTSAPQIA